MFPGHIHSGRHMGTFHILVLILHPAKPLKSIPFQHSNKAILFHNRQEPSRAPDLSIFAKPADRRFHCLNTGTDNVHDGLKINLKFIILYSLLHRTFYFCFKIHLFLDLLVECIAVLTCLLRVIHGRITLEQYIINGSLCLFI